MRRIRIAIGAATICLVTMLGSPVLAQTGGTRIIGWIENVQILPEKLMLTAKMDTGARTSSINVAQFVEFKRDGRSWVRFVIADSNGNQAVFERPVVRVARIRRSALRSTSRPVVMLSLCLGDIEREVEVNLANRSHLTHPMLVGRSMLAGTAIIDTSRTFTAKPECSGR